MRVNWAILLMLGVGGCTQYQPVGWDGHGSWVAARAAANQQRPAAGSRTASASYPGRHVVQPGETLSELAVRYKTTTTSLASANGMRAPYAVQTGQVLAVPAASRQRAPTASPPPRAPVVVARATKPDNKPAAPIRVASLEPMAAPIHAVTLEPPSIAPVALRPTESSGPAVPPPLSGDGFLWPVRGTIASAFGPKPNGARNDGINIQAPEGTPVLAAENGVVLYAGNEIPGYGRMLLIGHADGFMTAYAHNQELLVAVGTKVRRGQPVATVGRTGDVATPQLHFELRDNKEPIDPVVHLDGDAMRVASAS